MKEEKITISAKIADDLIYSYEPFVNDHTKCAVSATRFFALMRAVGESRAAALNRSYLAGLNYTPLPGTIGLLADMIEWVNSKIKSELRSK